MDNTNNINSINGTNNINSQPVIPNTNPVQTPVTTLEQSQPVETPAVQPAETQVVQPVVNNVPIQPMASVPSTPQSTISSPVIGMENNTVEEPKVEINETEAMIDKNKKIISASPQTIDSSSINVNEGLRTVSSETNVVSETVIDMDINNAVVEAEPEQKETTFEEVSLSVDNNILELTEEENNSNSIFNRTNETVEENSAPIKLGEEKHKFPYFMIFIFVLVIVAAFNIETVSKYINKFLNNTPVEEEEPVKKENNSNNDYVLDKALDISKVYQLLDESKAISDYESKNNIDINMNYDETNKKISFITSNYLNIEGVDNISIVFDIDDEHIKTGCESNIHEFCLVTTKALILAIAEVEEVKTNNYEEVLDTYLSNPFSNELKNRIFGVDVGESGTQESGFYYTYSISLKNKVKVI